MPKVIYREPMAKPCSDCPFRRKAIPGWLGASEPWGFIVSIQRDEPLPCHQTINYEDPKWKEKWEAGKTGKMCAGALILTANMCKLPRDPSFPRMKADRETVFANANEFMEYHSNAPVKSWEP